MAAVLVDRNRVVRNLIYSMDRGCLSKHGYLSRREARAVARRVERRNPGLRLYGYRCDHCGYVHLTKRRPD